MIKNSILGILALVLVFGMTSCGKGGKFSAKAQKMMDKKWTYDVEASRAAVGKAMTDAGVKNGADVVNLKGDVKKIANFLGTHSLQFYKSKGKFAWQRKSGKGLLSSTSKGWANWKDKDETSIELVNYNGKGKNAVFKIEELTDNKLVFLNEANRKKIYTSK